MPPWISRRDDDELAELFFQAFYWAWCRPKEDNSPLTIPEAFCAAWEKMRSSDRLHGTAIVIWMGRSIFDQPHTSRSPKNIRPKATVKTKKLEIEKQRERRLAHLEQLRNTAIDKLILVDLSVGAEVNYSLLHNSRQLLDQTHPDQAGGRSA